MNDEPTTGSPPIPTMVEFPSPSWVSSWPIWYVSVPDRETSPIAPSLKISAGMIPTFAFPGDRTPGQFGPIIVTPLPSDVRVHAQHFVRRDVLRDADDVVDPASTASYTASVAKRAGTKISVVFAPASETASATVLKTGTPSTSWPPLPGVTPATRFVP